MKPLLHSFTLFIRQIFKDSMLIAVILAPILAASFFRYVIPYVEQFLCGYFHKTSIIADYYLLFDLLLSFLTPYMFCFASAMVMLTEYDENLASYLSVTPVGKDGYMISRLVFPAFIALIASVLLLNWFSLTIWSFGMLIMTCILMCVMSITLSLLLFSLSHNRVEGMAVAKMSGLVMLGLPIPFFIDTNVQYMFSVLPSFWVAKYVVEINAEYLLPAIVTSLLWLWPLYRKFKRKLA